MKRIFLLLPFILLAFKILAQAPQVDSLIRLLNTTDNDTLKVEIYGDLSFYGQASPQSLKYAQLGLALAKKINYSKGIGGCYFELGNQYYGTSNSAMALHYYLEALIIWEKIGYKPGMGAGYLAIGAIYKEEGDYTNAIIYLRKAEAAKPDNLEPAALAYGTALMYSQFGEAYAMLNEQDSALKYFQRSYECFNSSQEEYQLNEALNGLGNVQLKMSNTELALGYFRQAIRNGIAFNDTLGLSDSYLGMAQLYDATGQKDSGIFYAEKSMFNAQRAHGLKNVLDAGKLLAALYKDKDDKKALSFLEISQAANDSLFNRQKTAQIQNMFLNETEREKELADKEKEAATKRSLNIELGLIAIGIVAFIMLFLLMSRSIIVTEKWISFFGVLGLLAVFEFINLIIHPSLEKVTHESPLLMLVAMVAVASLLIPLHHRIEKWIREKMTEKNKKIRLENAKKTIAELEDKST